MSEDQNQTSAPARRTTTATLMWAVLLVGVGLGVVLNLPPGDPKNWRERVVVLHTVALGLLVPLAAGLIYLLLGARATDSARRREGAGLAFAGGCVLATMVLGSLLFWVMVMAMVSR